MDVIEELARLLERADLRPYLHSPDCTMKPPCDCSRAAHVTDTMHRLKAWEKFSLWGAARGQIGTGELSEAEEQKRINAVFRYLLRSLSRQHIPNAEWVQKTFSGEMPLNSCCGEVGCFMEEDHTH